MLSLKKQYVLKFAILVISCLPAGPAWGQAPNPGPASVVVVANSAMEGSLQVARAYMERRQIPEKNLIVLETLTEERINRQSYLSTIHNPLLKALVERDLVNALTGKEDDLGRTTVSVFSNKVRYLVLCYGVPSRVVGPNPAEANDITLIRRQFKGTQASLVQTFQAGRMSKTEASVDGELSLLLIRDVPLRGFFPNPLYGQADQEIAKDILRVTRLDGPSPKAVIRMLDKALAGERNGLKGRAYVDEDGRQGGFAIGNAWMAGTAEVFDTLAYDLSHDTKRSTFSSVDRFDAPVLYAGWYSGNPNGPFLIPGWEFPDGAVAAHLHSFSAGTIRSTSKGWVGPLVDRGVSATFGNVAEPYLRMTHQFDLFFKALANGWNFGDAAYIALPGLSWQAVAIGDPLYRPFAVGLDEQITQLGDPLQILEDQYVVCRQIRLLVKSGMDKEARELADRAMRETPGPALALMRSNLYAAAGKNKQARKALSFVSQLPLTEPGEWGLYAEIADKLLELGEAKASFKIYQKLESQKMPEKVQLAFLKRGIKSAERAGESDVAIDWRVRTTPPPPPPPPPEPETPPTAPPKTP
jgi:uncharacterized protein (TIGR03790 family)